jgi:predicted helicase
MGITTGQDSKTIAETSNNAKIIAKEHKLSESTVYPLAYRPFDNRYLVYHSAVITRPRNEVMKHLLANDNLAVCFIRRTREGSIANFFITKTLVDKTILSSADNANVAPLYLYPTTQAEKDMGMTRTPNLSPEFLTKIEQNLGYQPTPEAIFYYIYAIFHSPTYRSRYAEFLKIDFPRVPLTSDDDLFRRLGELGEELVNLHLMKTTVPQSSFIENGGGCIVDAGHPKYVDGKVIINKKQDGFIDVPAEVWNFHVGGYQVLSKWLKDRKGRVLSQEDIAHYRGIVGALSATMRVMGEIDKAIPGFPIH